MQELRLVAVSEDGTYVVLAQPGRGTRFSLPNDERLRAVVRGQFSRLAQYEIEVESPLRPKEIQARIRAGETAEQIADAAGVPIERVRWFEGPVLAERAYMAQQAQTASVRRPGDSGPGPRLGEIVTERLRVLGADPDEVQWDSRKRGDGSWLVELTCEAGAERLTASWVFDPRRRHAMPEEDEAARLSLPEDALAAAGLSVQPDAPARGGGTVTPFVPRSGQPAARREVEAEPPPAPTGRPHAPAPAVATGTGAASQPVAQRQPSGERPPVTQQPSRHQPASTQAPPRVAREQVSAGPVTTEQAAAMAEEPAVGDEAAGSPGTPPQTSQEAPVRGRPGRKAAGGRGRRASVPTWDEIMFGSSRRSD
ncbi:MAG: septation protein SepH [Micromonosporaceae bacterium]